MEKEIILSTLHPGQEKVKQEAKRFNSLCCGRRWGKSEFGIDLSCDTVLDGHPVGYFAPTYKLLAGVYTEASSILAPIIKRRRENQFIETLNGGAIEFWSLENELAGRSRKYKRVVVDEAAFVKDLINKWNEAIRPTLTDLKGDGWFLSTPRGKNDFFKLHNRGISGEENWKSWQMSTYTNPYIDPLELNDAKKDLPELAWLQEYMAQFNDSIANPFGTAFIDQCTYPLSTKPAVCYGIDLAKSLDWTVIIGIDEDGCVCYFDRFQLDWRQTKQRILDLPLVPLCIDATGNGDPVVEDIVHVRGDVEAFKFTSESKQNLMLGLAVGIQGRKMTFPAGVIAEELHNFEYEFTSSGVKYAAPSGLHDDCVCALGLGWRKYLQLGGGKVMVGWED